MPGPDGEATSVGSIIAFLRLSRTDFDRDVDGAKRKARELGAVNPDVRIATNAAKVAAELAALRAAERGLGSDANQAKPFVIGLVGALASIAPAAVPIAAVAVGAVAGLIPVAATAVLGILGIRDAMQSGSLKGTQYGNDLHEISNELSNLKQIAAGGILNGIDQGLAASHGLFGELNDDVAIMSGQLGQVIAGAGPALLRILTDLNPLFVTFGTAVSNGAQHLEHWAQSSDGVSKFVAYVQAELPNVLHFLSELTVFLGHVLTAAAPFGGVLLHDLTLFVGVLNKIPVNVLSAAIPLAVSLYVAMKAYSGINVIIKGLSDAVEAMRAPFAGSALAAQASSLATRAAAAEEAAGVAAAKATEAEAAATAAAEIAASTAATGSVLADGAAASAVSAAEFAAAMRAEATAAATASAEIAASATAAADASAVAGAAARMGWASMLGPIGAVVIGGGLLATMFLHSGKAAQDAAAQINSYTQAIKDDSGAIAENTRQVAIKALQDAGALETSRKQGISLAQVTDAVLGNADAYKTVTDAIFKAREANADLYHQGKISGDELDKRAQALDDLAKSLGIQTDDVKKAAQAYENQQAALRGSTDAMNQQQVAAAALYGLTGSDGVNAYLAAAKATQDNTNKTAAQTLQFQLANDAASLLAQTIDKLSGKNLSYAQALNTFQSGLANYGNHISATGKKITFTTTSISDMSAASVELRGQLNSQVQSAIQAAAAYGDMKKSTEAGRQKLIELRQQLIDTAVANGDSREAVTAYIDTILKIPAKAPPTKLEVEKAEAERKLNDFIAKVKSIPDKTVRIVAVAQNVVTIQRQLRDAFGQPIYQTVIVDTANGTKDLGPIKKADGGTVRGPGGPKSDIIPALLSDGEEVTPEPQATKYRALLKAIAADRVPTVRSSAGSLAGVAMPQLRLPAARSAAGGTDTDALRAEIAALRAEVRAGAAYVARSASRDAEGIRRETAQVAPQVGRHINGVGENVAIRSRGWR